MINIKQIRKRVLLDGKIRVITLYEFLAKWGTQANKFVYFTEYPDIDKIIKVYKDNNFNEVFNVRVYDIKDGLVKIELF